MSTPTRVAQIQSSTPTIVKRIVLGTPIKTVAGSTVGIASLGGVSINTALNHDILVYNTSTGKFVNQHNTPGIVTANHYVITDSSRSLDYLNVTDLQAGDINFTGTLYQNGVAFGADSNLAPTISNIVTTLIDSAYIQLRQGETGTVDSAGVQTLIDSAYVQARQDFAYSSLTGTPNVLDSAAVIAIAGAAGPSGIDSAAVSALIDSAYIQARQIIGGNSSIDSAAIFALIDSNYIQYRQIRLDSARVDEILDIVDSDYIRYRYTPDWLDVINKPLIVDSAEVVKIIDGITTDDVAEGSTNLYYATARTEADVFAYVDSAYVSSRSAQMKNIYDRLDSFPGVVVTGNIEVTGDILPTIGNRFNIGSKALPFATGYFGAQTIVLGNVSVSDNGAGSVVFGKVDDSGEPIYGELTPVLLSDSNIARTTDLYWSADSNRLRIDVAGFETLRTEIGPFGTLTVNELRGPQNFVIDPSPFGTDQGTVIIRGGLVVEGTTTTINSTTITLADKNIVLAKDANNAVLADQAGFTINGANASMLYKYTTNSMDFNKRIKAPSFQGVYLGFDSDFSKKTTNDLIEGTKNLYYNDQRVYDFINVYVDETYIRDRQSYTGGNEVDSALVASIVSGLVDSNNLSNLSSILGAATDISGVINSIVTATYINNRFAAASGTATTVTSNAALHEFVYQPESPVTIVQGSDINDKVLTYTLTNVQVYLNGSRLVQGLDYITDSNGGGIGSSIAFYDTVGPGNTIVISDVGTTEFNFVNTVEKINSFFADTLAYQVADSFLKTAIRSVKYVIGTTVTVNSQPKHEVRELLLIHNNLNVFLTEYGQIGTVDSSLAEFDASIIGADVLLTVTPAYPNTTVKILRTPIEV